MYPASWLEIRDDFYHAFFSDDGREDVYFSTDLIECALFGC